MRVGIICEGPTDFVFLKTALSDSLSRAGVTAEIVAIQPPPDETNPEAGWGNVLLWLKNNPLKSRLISYLGPGMFANEMSNKRCDCILIQMDTDILGDPGFSAFVQNEYGCGVGNPTNDDDRANEIRAILDLAAELEKTTEAVRSQHVLTPVVESTETWAVSAVVTPPRNFEKLKAQELCDAFMRVLHLAEGRIVIGPFATIDKSQKRRRSFCSKLNSQHIERLENSIPRYASCVAAIISAQS